MNDREYSSDNGGRGYRPRHRVIVVERCTHADLTHWSLSRFIGPVSERGYRAVMRPPNVALRADPFPSSFKHVQLPFLCRPSTQSVGWNNQHLSVIRFTPARYPTTVLQVKMPLDQTYRLLSCDARTSPILYEVVHLRAPVALWPYWEDRGRAIGR